MTLKFDKPKQLWACVLPKGLICGGGLPIYVSRLAAQLSVRPSETIERVLVTVTRVPTKRRPRG